jgi:hypothetical protein
VHPLDMFNQLVWRQLDILPADRKAATLTVVSFKVECSALARVCFTDAHCPAGHSKHSLADQIRFLMGAVDVGRRGF